MNKKQGIHEQISANQTLSLQNLKKKQSEMEQKSYEISNYQEYPQRLISYIRTKVYKIGSNENERKAISKGTCCFIDENIFLTVAHNLAKYQYQLLNFDNLKIKHEDISYVKQGLGDNKYIGKYKISKMLINPKYFVKQQNSEEVLVSNEPQEDFALVLVNPMAPQSQQQKAPIIEQKFMPIVMISQSDFKEISQFEIPGYPVRYNKNKKNVADSSCYMHEQIKTSGELKSYDKNIVRYQAKNQEGFSGAPIIVQYRGQKIIIAIHKGMTEANKEGLGVSASSMIYQLNEWGYQLKKKPFVFTQKTLKLRGRQQEMRSRQILLLTDNRLQAHDILVYTSFDLSKLKTIYLTGNSIGNQGVQFLLRRKYPQLTKLYLTQNSIADMTFSDLYWKNVSELEELSLASNQLTTLPKGIKQLTKLNQLWLTRNKICKIPDSLLNYCQLNNRRDLAILIYENKIDCEAEKAVIAGLSNKNFKIIWNRVNDQ